MTSQAGPLSTEELFRMHGPFVERFLARLGVPAAQAEDALQDVFLVVHRNGGYRPGLAKPTSYLAGIAIHAAHRVRRRERVDRARHTDASTELMPSGAADPTRSLLAHEELERLQRALDRLPEELRTTLVLVDIEGESCLSVAAALSVPVGTVYSRLHAARKRLQLALQALETARARPRPGFLQATRGERTVSLGLFGWLGMDRSFERSQAGQLLRLARLQPTAAGASAALLARLPELLRAATDAPLAGLVTQPAGWIGVLGPLGLGTIAGVGSAALAGVWLTFAGALPPMAAESARDRQQERAALQPDAATSSALGPQLAAPSPSHVPPASLAPAPTPSTANATRTPERPSAGVSRAAVKTPAAQRAHREPSPSAANSGKETTATVSPTPAPSADLSASAPARGEPAASDAQDSLQEMQQLANAERLLGSAPARALAQVRALRTRFPQGYMREESAYVELMALRGLGRGEEAREHARAFLRAYPASPYAARVRSLAESAVR